MKNILFYDAKDYEKPWFDKYNQGAYSFDYIESKLDKRTVALAKGYDGICIFINDEANAAVVQKLKSYGIGLIALRCSGYNNVDVAEAQKCGIAVPAKQLHLRSRRDHHLYYLSEPIHRKAERVFRRFHPLRQQVYRHCPTGRCAPANYIEHLSAIRHQY